MKGKSISTNVIKGGYQVTTPNPPPAPSAGNWGTAVPTTVPPSSTPPSTPPKPAPKEGK